MAQPMVTIKHMSLSLAQLGGLMYIFTPREELNCDTAVEMVYIMALYRYYSFFINNMLVV